MRYYVVFVNFVCPPSREIINQVPADKKFKVSYPAFTCSNSDVSETCFNRLLENMSPQDSYAEVL